MTCSDVLGAGSIHDGFCALLEVLVAELALLKTTFIDVFVAPGNSLLRGHAVPEPVTSEQHEVAVGLSWGHGDVGAGSYSLVSGFHRGVLFVLKIPESSGEGKLAVDATILNKAVRIVDAFALLWIIRLVIFTQGHCLFPAREDSS